MKIENAIKAVMKSVKSGEACPICGGEIVGFCGCCSRWDQETNDGNPSAGPHKCLITNEMTNAGHSCCHWEMVT